MALLRFRRTTHKAGGHVAGDLVRYITRQPLRALSHAEQYLRYSAGDREDLVYTQSRNLPAWAEGHAHRFFQAAEKYERANGIAYEEWKIALPQELSHSQNMALTRDLVTLIAGETLPITYAFHDPTTMDGEHQQPHIHLIISARKNDGISRTPEQHFRRYNPKHPERGGAKKDDAFRHLGAVKAHRVLIADVINLHLEHAAHLERLDPRTLETQGIDRQPEPKLWPEESRDYREKGTVSETMQQVLLIRAERQRTRPAEQLRAQAYWDARKVVLGIEAGMERSLELACIAEARERVRDHAPEHVVASGREMSDAARTDNGQALTAADVDSDLDALTRQLGAWDQDHDQGHRRGRVHIWGREREQGMTW